MKREKEEDFECPLLPDDVWRLILSLLSFVQKMVFSQTTKQNYILAMESVTILRVADFRYPPDYSCSLGDSELSRFYQLRELALNGSHTIITDRGLSGLSCLQTLNLMFDHMITGACVEKLTTLTKLNLAMNQFISGSHLIPLSKNLTSLNLGTNDVIESSYLTALTSLRELSLDFNNTILDEHLSELTGLTSLSLRQNRKICHSLLCLTNLRELNLGHNNISLNDEILSVLESLESLRIDSSGTLTGQCLKTLTNLRSLILCDVSVFQFDYIIQCVGLTTLFLPYYDDNITDSTLAHLTNLVSLDLGYVSSKSITLETIKSLKRLRSIRLRGSSYNFDINRLKEELPSLEFYYRESH